MSEIDRDSIIEAVKKPINRIFEALENLDAEALLENYHMHEEFRFIGLIFGQIVNLLYDEFVIAIKSAYQSMKEQKFIRETEFFNVLSETKVIYNTTGWACQVRLISV